MVILKTLVGNLSANVNEITFTDNIIDGNSIIEVYYNNNDIYTVETWQREHTIGIVTSDHDFPVSVKVLINNVVAFEPYDDSEVLSQLSDLDNRVYHAEDAISGLTTRVGSAEDDIDALETAMADKQDVLIAGDNITIENNVISASGGSSIDYSTTERVVGTWIDGKPLYQKTINFGTLPVRSTKTVEHGISNIKNIYYVEAIANYTGIVYGGLMPLVDTSHTFRVGVRDTIAEVVSPSDDWSSYTAYITVRYTKTTDYID